MNKDAFDIILVGRPASGKSGDDFLDLAAADATAITINGIRVPYAVFENENDVISGRGAPWATTCKKPSPRCWPPTIKCTERKD